MIQSSLGFRLVDKLERRVDELSHTYTVLYVYTLHTLGGNYALLQAHMYGVGTNAGQMDRWTQITTDRYTEGNSHTCWEPLLRHPTDLASWPLQRALKRLEGSLPLPFLFLLPSHLLSSLWPLSKQPITLMALFSTLSPSLPPVVWVTSRNLGLMSPEGCFGRQPALVSQTETTLSSPRSALKQIGAADLSLKFK